MRNTDLKWKIDEWLVEFDNEVDACFSAGESEKGEAAFHEWHDRVFAALASFDKGLGTAFEGKGWKKQRSADAFVVTRAQFMRSCGRPAKAYLRRLKTDLQKNSLA